MAHQRGHSPSVPGLQVPMRETPAQEANAYALVNGNVVELDLSTGYQGVWQDPFEQAQELRRQGDEGAEPDQLDSRARALSAVAIIPARGGSKGVPRKNLAPIGSGETLLSRAVRTCLASPAIGLVYVSTEDAEIQEAALDCGAGVIRRPLGLAGDWVQSEQVISHAVTALGLTDGIMVLVQCTAPLMTSSDITRCVLACDTNGGSAFAASPFHGCLWSSDGEPLNHPGGERRPRQAREVQWVEAGSCYAMDVARYARSGSRFCGPVAVVPSDDLRWLEVDTPQDLDAARVAVGGAVQ